MPHGNNNLDLSLSLDIEPKTVNQRSYVTAMRDERKSLIFCLGVAGTGKTVLAVTEALRWLAGKERGPRARGPKPWRIILTRPPDNDRTKSIEELCEPMIYALEKHYHPNGPGSWRSLLRSGQLELCTMEEMRARGRNIDNAFVVW